jgi:hypothetical protein
MRRNPASTIFCRCFRASAWRLSCPPHYVTQRETTHCPRCEESSSLASNVLKCSPVGGSRGRGSPGAW